MNNLRVLLFHLKEYIRCTTPKKFVNLILLKSQRFFRLDKVSGMPYKYFIDPINICNLRCPLCPTGKGVLARPRGRLKLEDLKRIVDEIAPFAYRIELYNWGEPFLHPDIFEMIEYIGQYRISTGLSSNLNHMNPQMAEKLVNSGLNQILVSIDGATQQSYEIYRRNGKLDVVLKNLELIINTKIKFHRSNPFIIWRMLVGRHNEHEVEIVRKKAKEIGVDSFTTGSLYVNTNDPEQIEQWVPLNPKYNPYSKKDHSIENTWDCNDLWESMVINWDGGIAPCCWLHDSQFDFGNVSTETIREVWHSATYESARRVILGRGRKNDIRTICHRCLGHPDYMDY